jgi:MarR family transcriptional repressor of emrRAB
MKTPLELTPVNFPAFEAGIRDAAKRVSGLPADEIILIHLYRHFSKALLEQTNRRLAPFGITLPGWQILIWLTMHPGEPVNPSQICDLISESPTGITRLTDDLVARNWIERKPSPNDRRRVDIVITAAGRALVEKAKPVLWEHLEQVFGVLTRAEIHTLDALMRKLLASVDRLNESGGAS